MSEHTNMAYDLVVLGSGSGGMAGAKRAARYGAKVAIIENDRIGGTCVIRGCVPKKLMAIASHLGHARHIAPSFGWSTAPSAHDGGHDWTTLQQMRDAVVDRLELRHEATLKEHGIDVIHGRGHIVDAHTVQVVLNTESKVGGPKAQAKRQQSGSGPTKQAGTPQTKTLRAKHILIAVGARPVLPTIEGCEHVNTSDTLFELDHCPKSAILVGGGYIAVEFAGVLQALGCKTTLLVRSQLLRGFDRTMADGLYQAMQQAGVDVRLNAQITRIEEHGEGQQQSYTAHVRQEIPAAPAGDTEVVEVKEDTLHSEVCMLFAIGRHPNTDNLGLEDLGIKLGPNGSIPVDEHHTTTVPNIYAVGDAIDKVNLTPVAIHAARTLCDRVFGGHTGAPPMSYDNIPSAVFSQPPIGTVGLTEEAARQRYGDCINVHVSNFPPMLYSGMAKEEKVTTRMKLIVNADTDRVLGCHILGDDAPEIIQGFAAALQAGATKATFDQTIGLHPSSAEEMVLMPPAIQSEG